MIGRDTEGITLDNAIDYVRGYTELVDPAQVTTAVSISGTVRAESSSYDLPSSTVAETSRYVARWVPLGPDKVVMSGAPNTFVPVSPGDLVEITLTGIGTLSHRAV